MTEILSQDEIDALLTGVSQSNIDPNEPIDNINEDINNFTSSNFTPVDFNHLDSEEINKEQTSKNIINLLDARLKVHIELGRKTLTIKEIYKLQEGSILQLNELAGTPLNLYIAEKLFAKVEVLVIDESYSVRITKLYDNAKI